MAKRGKKKSQQTVRVPLPDATEKNWALLKAWVEAELRAGRAPRVTEIVQRGKHLKLPAKTVRHLLQSRIPAYRQTVAKSFKPKRAFAAYRASSLGWISMDLAFFTRGSRELADITGERSPGAVLLGRDILNLYSYAIPLSKSKGRSAAGLAEALEKFLVAHRQANRGHPVRFLLWDREKAATSHQVLGLLASHGVRIKYFSFSKSKSCFAENMVRQMREKFTRLKLATDKDWKSALSSVVEEMNDAKILVDGKPLKFSPRDVTQKKLPAFLAALESARPSAYFRHFSLSPEMINFKYALGSLVVAKTKAISTAVLVKRSEMAADTQVFRVIDRVAYFSSRMEIVPSYTLRKLEAEEEGGLGRRLRVDDADVVVLAEEALIPVTLD